MSTGITLLGLGPGDPVLLTRQAWEELESTPVIYLRTRHHPAISGFPPGITIHSFDDLYADKDTFEAVYEGIVERVLELGRRPEGIVYAVPGSPFVAEATTPEIQRRATQEGIPIRIIEGLSFLEPTLSLLGSDLLPHTAIVDALLMVSAHVPPFPADIPALIAQIYSQSVASEVKLTLAAIYPDEHPVKLVHAAGTPDASVDSIPLYELDRSQNIGLLTCLYVPPLGPGTSFEAFQEIVAHLRAPDGCPWDKEQTHRSLRPYLLEEAYEALSALDSGEAQSMLEEFGDLLLQIVLHAQIANENGDFDMADVLQTIHAKIVRRHPHVFGDINIEGVGHVLKNWERLKAAERAEKGTADQGLLAGVALALPALVQAEQFQKRAARVGFDWPSIEGVVEKVEEELGEVLAAPDEQRLALEIGDLLFAVVNLARWYEMDAESALREANARFRQRFSKIEEAARQQGKELSDLSLSEMEDHWQAAKKDEGAN